MHNARPFARIVAGLTTAVVLGATASLTVATAAHADTSGATYYVNANSGDDSAAGTSPTAAWQSLSKVDQTTFQPGDQILFADGSSWTGQLWPKGSGTSAASITIGSYGSGAQPKIEGAGQVADAVKLWNQQYWDITGIDVSNNAPATSVSGANLGDFRGIHIGGDNGTALSGFVVNAVTVHDVTGEDDWIGSGTSNNPGIHFSTGWDRSKNTGGIVFNTTVTDIANPGNPTTLNDITVENSVITNTSFGGIVLKQYTGDAPGATATGWGDRSSATDTRFAPHTNVSLHNNYITQAGTPYGCDGIYITGTRDADVADNVIDHAGTSGIESYDTDNVTIEHNEVFDTQKKAGGSDYNAIDTDIASTNQIVQYNYVSGNGEGVLIYQQRFGSSIWRYNVIANSLANAIHAASATSATSQVYNNTIIDTVGGIITGGGGAFNFQNNIFYTTHGSGSFINSFAYAGNLYGGMQPPSTESAALIADPRFVNATLPAEQSGTVRTTPNLSAVDGLRLTQGSPAINTATAISNNGGADLAGDVIYNGAPDMGAFEYSTPAGASTETISGIVTDSSSGNPISGATVSVTGSSATTTTDASGRFALSGVPFETGATLTVAKANYDTVTQTVDVIDGNDTTVAVKLKTNVTIGTISGKVFDASASPLGDADVKILNADGADVADLTTGTDGAFSASNVTIGSGYGVAVTAPGFQKYTTVGITVTPATTTVVPPIALVPNSPTYLATHTFDNLPIGTLANGADGFTVSPQGGTILVDANGHNGNEAVLARATNSGSTSLSEQFATPLKGILTVDSEVMRNDSNSGSANFFGVPYIRGSNGTNSVSVGFSKGEISAYNGTTSLNIQPYVSGQWYQLREVVNTVAQTYDLYIDGKKVLSNAAFRAALDGIATIDYYANAGNFGTVHVDDLAVSRGVGYTASEAGLGTLTTDQGTPAATNATTYTLSVPASISSVNVSAQALSPLAQSVTVNGAPATAGQVVTLDEGAASLPIVVTAEDGTTASYTLQIAPALPKDSAKTAPAKGVLSTTQGWANGLDDGNYNVVMNLWYGSNATEYVLYQDGKPIFAKALTANSPSAQSVTVPVTGLPNGSYVYQAALLNGAGITKTDPITVKVTDANPGTPVLSNDDYSHTANFTVTTNMWWGTNATDYKLYEDGTLIDEQTLTAATPAAQHATTKIAGASIGSHTFTAVLSNADGSTTSAPMTVAVNG